MSTLRVKCWESLLGLVVRGIVLYQEFDIIGFKEIKEFLFLVDVDLRGEIEPRYILCQI